MFGIGRLIRAVEGVREDVLIKTNLTMHLVILETRDRFEIGW